ncbi:MAG: hypothetical protein ABIO45_06955, partial [Burkholderiaceae bacterium]
RYELGLEHAFGIGGTPVVDLRRFSESTSRQMATLFGVGADSDSGHYYVASSGNVEVTGWRVGLRGDVARHVHGSVEYTVGEAVWSDQRRDGKLWRLAPSASRRGSQRLHDLTGRLEASLPDSSTRVVVAYRLDNGFSARNRSLPVVDGRFNLEIRQALPYQPFRTGKVNAVLDVRTLRRDVLDDGAFFDELLTVGAPIRVTGGFQVQF